MAVSYYDNLVRACLLDLWERRVDGVSPNYSVCLRAGTNPKHEKHLRNCDGRTLEVTREASWDCGCYSEYTQDDMFNMDTVVSCGHGCSVKVGFVFSDYTAPNLIKELEEFESTWDCIIDPKGNER